jgi:hypothetical protein
VKIDLRKLGASERAALGELLKRCQDLKEEHSRFLTTGAVLMVAREVGEAFETFEREVEKNSQEF